jgi:hypothetical protein
VDIVLGEPRSEGFLVSEGIRGDENLRAATKRSPRRAP